MVVCVLVLLIIVIGVRFRVVGNSVRCSVAWSHPVYLLLGTTVLCIYTVGCNIRCMRAASDDSSMFYVRLGHSVTCMFSCC